MFVRGKDRNGKERGQKWCLSRKGDIYGVCKEKEQAKCLSGEKTNMVTVMGDDVNGLCQEK